MVCCRRCNAFKNYLFENDDYKENVYTMKRWYKEINKELELQNVIENAIDIRCNTIRDGSLRNSIEDAIKDVRKNKEFIAENKRLIEQNK